jgi:protein required for attachment to host cells
VERSAETGQFVTVQELDGSGRLAATRAWVKSHPPGRSVESGGTLHHDVGKEDPYRQTKAEFAAEVAAALARRVITHGRDGVVLVAPARILGELRKHLDPGAKVLNTLAKDLGKTPDHELHEWLDTLELVAEAPAGSA